MRFYADVLAIPRFRKFENLEAEKAIQLGRKITVFAGQNGVGKSNVLSLIASTFGITHRRYTGGNFHPEFSDFFTIPEEEEYDDYTSYLKVVNTENESFIQKRHSYKDDTKEERGIRLIPRATNYFTPDQKLSKVKQETKDTFYIGGDQRIPLPSIFISLSRLFPIGETLVSKKNVRSNNIIITSDAYEMYKKWYNEILPNSISEKEVINITKDIDKNRTIIHMPLNKTLPETQSVGQDNIGYIVSALVDFYLHKQKTENYNGGILCIDEIDASLHPNAQLRLFDLLDRLSEELELQIFVTTHSLTILKKIIKKQSRSSEDYRLVYFVDPELPRLSSIEHYADIKSDMFDKMTPYRPYVKIYCEDDMTEFLFNELIEAYKRLHPDTKSDIYKVIPIHLGCKQLLKLPEYDSHFKDVLIIVDGDTKTNSNKLLYPYINADEKLIKGVKTNELPQNVIALPTFLAPESFIYYVVKTIVDNENYNKFWKDLEDREESRLYTKSRINEVLNQINIKDDTKNDDIKSLERLQELQKFITDTQLFNYLMEENIIDELIDFCLKVYSQINILLQREKSKNY